MSTLTKICIVLMVVLVLIACPVFIQKALFDYDWKAFGQNMRTKYNVAAATAQAQRTAAQRWKSSYENAQADSAAKIGTLQKTIEDKTSQIGGLNSQLATAQAEITVLTAHLTGMKEQLAGLNQRIGVLDVRLEAQRTANIKLADQLRQSIDKNREYLVIIDNAKKRAEVLAEQLADRESEIQLYKERIQQMDAELARLKTRAGLADTVAVKPVATADERIEGTVLAVKGPLVSLNVGAASKVTKGMVFIIYRDDKFVGHVRVERVDASTCAGVVVYRSRDIQQGDKATTRLD